MSVNPAEGGAATYTVVLNTQPTESVDITVARALGGDTDLTASPDTLTFTTTDWSMEQTVTVSAGEDADGLDGTASFTHTAVSADGTYHGITIDSVTATEDDNDEIGVTVSTMSVNPAEGGAATYTVVLDTEPTESVDITVARALGGDTDLTASPAVLTFTTTDWSMEQTVTVSAGEDADGLDGTASFTHTADSVDGTYHGITIDSVTATEDDNDAIGVTVSTMSVNPAEGGAATYTVVLDTEPTASVDIMVARALGGDTDLTASPDTLTFTTTDWSMEQTVTVSAGEDADGLDGTASFTHTAVSADGTYHGITIDSVTATEDDNDEIGVTVSTMSVNPAEGGAATYTVVLDTEPTASVDIMVARALGGDTDLTASPDTLTFTTTDWSMEQTVTVSAGEDADALYGTASFTHTAVSADSTYHGITIDSVTAIEDDNDATTVSVSADAASVNEGVAARFTVTVNGALTIEDLTVGFTVSGTATAGSDYTAPISTSLTIPAGSPSGSVAIGTIEDSVLDDGETLIVALASVSNTVNLVSIGTPNSATVTISDGGTVTLSISDAAADEGATARFTVTMSGRVESEVTVDWNTRDNTATAPYDYAAASGRLTFGLGETLTRTVAVQILNDALAEGNETFVVALLNLTGPSGVSLDANRAGTGTILDDVEAAAVVRHGRVHENVLPRVSKAMATSTLSAVTSRIDMVSAGAAAAATPNLVGPSALYHFLRFNRQALEDGTLSTGQFLSRLSFVLPPEAAGDGALGLSDGVAVWGSGDYRELSGREDSSVDWKGDLLSVHLGADTSLWPDLLAGFSVSWSKGKFDFADRTDPVTVSGVYESRMSSVHPYANWSVREGLDLWATVGYGRGGVNIKEEDSEDRSSDTQMKAAAAGVSSELLSKDGLIEGGTTRLKFKGEGSFARVELAGNDRKNRLSYDVLRTRMALEASHERRLASGSTLFSSLEIGHRHDGGDGGDAITGAGAELGGALRYRDPAVGLTLGGRVRVLVAHQEDYDEWGIGGLVRFNPDPDGTGLSLSISPAWGEIRSEYRRLYEQGTAGLAANDNEPAGRLDADIGYGFRILGGRGLLTPYGGLTLAGARAQRCRIGGRFELGRSAELRLEGERREASSAPEHRVTLRGQVRF